MTNPTCSSCRFFQDLHMRDEPGFEASGLCRRYPPAAVVQVVGDGDSEENGHFLLLDRRSSWQPPFLDGDKDWCGEHAPTQAIPIVPDDAEAQHPNLLGKFMLRMPFGMRSQLKAAAKANNRTMNAEIISRLKVG